MAIIVKSTGEFAAMRRAGMVVASILKILSKEMKAGMTGRQLDDIAVRELARYGATPSFKGHRGFPAALRVSINEEVVHSIRREMHEEPQIPNFGPPGHGPVLRKGMTLAIEPMVNIGGWELSLRTIIGQSLPLMAVSLPTLRRPLLLLMEKEKCSRLGISKLVKERLEAPWQFYQFVTLPMIRR